MSFYAQDGTPLEELKPSSHKRCVFECDYHGCTKTWIAEYRHRSKTSNNLCPHHRHLGHTHSFETKEKLSEIARAKKRSFSNRGTSSIRDCGKHNIYYREWRNILIANSGGMCEMCGVHPGEETHHSVIRYKDIVKKIVDEFVEKDLEADKSELGRAIGKYHLDNKIPGMWLCHKCHIRVHQQDPAIQLSAA